MLYVILCAIVNEIPHSTRGGTTDGCRLIEVLWTRQLAVIKLPMVSVFRQEDGHTRSELTNSWGGFRDDNLFSCGISV